MAKARANYSRLGGQVIVGHESPHKFDQFSLDHMGSGQGAQSYSKGLYFWENPRVGRHYNEGFSELMQDRDPAFNDYRAAQNALQQWSVGQNFNSYPYNTDFLNALQSERMARTGKMSQPQHGGFGSDAQFRTLFSPQAVDELTELHKSIPLTPFDHSDTMWLDAAENSAPYYAQAAKHIPLSDRVALSTRVFGNPQIRPGIGGNPLASLAHGTGTSDLDQLRRYADGLINPKYLDFLIEQNQPEKWVGHMAMKYPLNRFDYGPRPIVPPPPPKPQAFSYHTKLNAGREDFVDLDASIWRQPPAMRRVLLDAADELGLRGALVDDGGDVSTTPKDLWKESYDAFYEADGLGEFERALLDRGVPGVRYDDYSRNLDNVTSKTQNFVVYDPAIAEIIKRWPYSVLAPLLLSGDSQESEPSY